ncbi:MAG: RNA polymerase sigma factor, partial [Myxococcales bacterium]|nr:RNA polymerase sigma factor [Myxococcales bacterium]
MLRGWHGRGTGSARDPAPSNDALGQSLVQRFRRGDRSAFTDIFRAYRGLVVGLLHDLLRDDPELEDVVQAAFLEVFRSLHTFQGRAKLSSWVARVALHVGYHHLRRRKSRPGHYRSEPLSAHLADGSSRADPTLSVEREETLRRVIAILDHLAPKKREAFILNDLRGLSQEEVAEIVGTSVATVRTRLFYARQEFWRRAALRPGLAQLGVAPRRG